VEEGEFIGILEEASTFQENHVKNKVGLWLTEGGKR